MHVPRLKYNWYCMKITFSRHLCALSQSVRWNSKSYCVLTMAYSIICLSFGSHLVPITQSSRTLKTGKFKEANILLDQ